jgi:hypothetical protein
MDSAAVKSVRTLAMPQMSIKTPAPIPLSRWFANDVSRIPFFIFSQKSNAVYPVTSAIKNKTTTLQWRTLTTIGFLLVNYRAPPSLKLGTSKQRCQAKKCLCSCTIASGGPELGGHNLMPRAVLQGSFDRATNSAFPSASQPHAP